METLWQDIKYGARLLKKSPGFTAVAVLTLALGIGANSAIFSVVNAILLKPLPYPEAERLVFLTESSEQVPNMSFSFANFKDVRDQNTVFESVMASNTTSWVLTGEDEPERLLGRQATVGMFQTLGIQPMLGRAFTAEEDQPGGGPVVLISEGLWSRRFARDPAIVGKQLTLNGEPFEVIGVLPGTFHGTLRQAEVWSSLGRLEDRIGGEERRGNHPGIYLVARTKPGVAVEQARAEVVGIAQRLAEQYPNSNAKQSMTVVSLLEAVVGNLSQALIVLLGAVAFVLLIACANVANLLLARAATRQKELAMRTTLGAGRGRIVRQLLTESLLISLTGGALGLAVAYGGMKLLVAASPASTPRIGDVTLDASVLVFTFAIAVGTGLIFGLLPALQSSKVGTAEILKEGGRGGVTGVAGRRARNALVIAEVSLALVLLIGAGLMLKSFVRLLDANPGFDPQGVMTMTVNLPQARYGDDAQRSAFFQRLLEGLDAVPGVESYAVTAPLLGGWQTSFTVEGRPEPLPGQRPSTDITRISPGYFRTMRVPLLRGRAFDERDVEGQTRVAIIDQTFAETHWPGEEAIGKRIKFGPVAGDGPWLEVVGIVGHVKHYGVDQDSRVETYVPHAQSPVGFGTIVLRASAGEPAAVTSAVRAALRAVDPNVPLYGERPLEAIVADSQSQRRLSAQLLGAFAALAVVLSAIGIYGVMSYSVTQRTHELGIRMALGAEKEQVVRLVLRQGMVLAGVGVALGLVLAFGLAFGLTQALSTMLFRVSATDPPTYAFVPVVLAMVALVACYIPARRVLRVDPLVALRHE